MRDLKKPPTIYHPSMKRLGIILLSALLLAAPTGAQTRKSTTKKATTTQQRKSTTKKTKRTSSSKKRTSTKKSSTKTATYTNAKICGLQSQRSAIQKKIREQEQALKKNKADVAARLQNLMMVNGQIDQSQKNIENIQKDIHHIEGNIGILKSQLHTLEAQLKSRQAKYIQSMRYLARHRTVQDKIMFIFSAKNLVQMYFIFRRRIIFRPDW